MAGFPPGRQFDGGYGAIFIVGEDVALSGLVPSPIGSFREITHSDSSRIVKDSVGNEHILLENVSLKGNGVLTLGMLFHHRPSSSKVWRKLGHLTACCSNERREWRRYHRPVPRLASPINRGTMPSVHSAKPIRWCGFHTNHFRTRPFFRESLGRPHKRPTKVGAVARTQ